MDAVILFKALADPARVRIVEFLRRPDEGCCTFPDRVCACDVESLLGLSQPAVSHHFKILMQAGLVVGEKDGRWMYYRLVPDAFARAMAFLQPFAATPAGACGKRPAPPARVPAAA